jgi:hypothetical protein
MGNHLAFRQDPAGLPVEGDVARKVRCVNACSPRRPMRTEETLALDWVAVMFAAENVEGMSMLAEKLGL